MLASRLRISMVSDERANGSGDDSELEGGPSPLEGPDFVSSGGEGERR